MAIYDINGNLKAKYLYDAWGNCTIASETTDYDVANANPIRYRGYYYDSDTGLYYLNARYYSPKWRRFISPDSTEYLDPKSVNGLNLYCYCNNDPVNYVDPSGCAWETILDVGFALWSLYDLINKPSWKNAGLFAFDLLALAVPFLPGGSKVITKADDLIDAVGFVGKYDEVIVLGQSMGTRVIPYADNIGASVYNRLDGIYSMWEITYGYKMATAMGYLDNMDFIISRSLNGAKFIDKGFDATRTLKGLRGRPLFAETVSRATIYSERFFAQTFRWKNVVRVVGYWLYE